VETYYKPEDLPKFEEIGKEASDLAKKFLDYYHAVFSLMD
jgi:4-carboxymuconolactone decarboxylase